MKPNWPQIRLGDVCNIIGGFAFKGNHFSDIKGDVKITDINSPYINYNDAMLINLSYYDREKLEKYIVQNTDFVVAMTGATIGKIGRYFGKGIAYINQRVAKISPKNGIDKNYIYYSISGNDFQRFILNNIDSQSAQANISSTSIGRFPILLPPLPIQRTIAVTLSCLDDKIELNNRINANLEAQAQAIFKSWFVDFEPFRDGEFVDSELGKIPKGWRTGTLGDICHYSSAKIDISSLTTKNYISTENMLSNKAGFKSAVNLPTVKQTTMFNAGDVLISNIRPYFKKIVYCDLDGGCSADVLCLKPYSPKESAFLYFTVYADEFFDHMVSGSKGTKMPRGDKSHIMNYLIVIPPENVIFSYKDIAEPILSLKSNLTAENTRLSAIRDSLLPKLMVGEIDI
ncbi:MAG: restriction endonuclease subunit S [Prevotellaceae bacterium]|jgi:type I restriction enzyme S subunit|nr:restriction endonuclease subunit S [Prevotellaceae bacterium]